MMCRKIKEESDLRRHLSIGVYVNLFAALILVTGSYFSKRPALKVVVPWLGLILFGGLVQWLISTVIRARWRKVKHFGYYFLLTTPFFWALDQRRARLSAEEMMKRLNMILESLPETSLVTGIVDPERRKESLLEIVNKVHQIEDYRLAHIVGYIRYYAKDLLTSAGDYESYQLFRVLIENIVAYEPYNRPETYMRVLWMLSDIFEMPPLGGITRQVQKDMLNPLIYAIHHVDNEHLYAVRGIVEKIMTDEEDKHDFARPILNTLLDLDWEKKRQLCQIIFDESRKRAFRFPRHFGHDFLDVLGRLGHRVFWLDIQSVREIFMEHTIYKESGVISLNQMKYNELSSKVFTPLEDPEHAEVHHGRVYRRLKGITGKVKIECTLPNGERCTCEGESLSFRGCYSQDCVQKAGTPFKARITPILEVNEQFDLKASVTMPHTDEYGEQTQGRGIFFEDANESSAKDLYEYISKTTSPRPNRESEDSPPLWRW